MKMLLTLIIGASAVVLSNAYPAYDASQPPAQVVNSDIDHSNLPNSYRFHYDASDGSSRTEQGSISNPNTDQAALGVTGVVKYYDKGHLYQMLYISGKRGYRTIIRKLS